jgi:glycosyltransferase involved in cell wall biosynthesis
MTKKRVVLLRSNPVAPDPPVEKAADALLAKGYKVTVVGWSRDEKLSEKQDDLFLERGKAEIIRFGIPANFGGGFKKNLFPLIKFQKRLYSWLKKHRNEYDVIHAFDFDTGFVANKISKKYGKALIYHILDFYIDSHSMPTAQMNKWVKEAEFDIINNANCTIICTEKRKEQILGSKPKKLEIIHNTPKPAKSIDTPVMVNGSPDRCKIVYVGILAGSRFIRELMDFVKKDDRFELHIGGFGLMEEEIAKAATDCKRIVFYGKLPYEKTLALEEACDIMTAIYNPAVPNHKYAAPNKFYESLMLGKPVIMAKNTGFDEIIEEHHIGCLIEYSTEGLERGLNSLYDQKEHWPEVRQRMKELYNDQFSWAEMERRLTKLYEELDS